MRVLIALALVLALPAAAWTQDLEECRTPDLEVPGFDDKFEMVPTADELEVDAEMVIGELELFLDITTTFQGDWSEISVTSPFQTAVLLHAGTGGFNSDFDVVYSDSGDPNTGEAGLYDCDGCAIQPAAPRGLSRFAGEPTAGTWTLDMLTFTGGTLNEWCILVEEGCALASPDDVSCTESDGLDIELTWQLPEDTEYSSIEVERNGRVVASVDGDMESATDPRVPAGAHRYRVYGVDDDCRSGSALCMIEKTDECDVDAPDAVDCLVGEQWPELTWSSLDTGFSSLLVIRNGLQVADLVGTDEAFIDERAPNGRLRYQVVGVLEDDECLVASETCEVVFGNVDTCSTEDVAIDGDDGDELGDPVEETLEVVDGTVIRELELDLDIETDFFTGCWDVILVSPEGTAVQVHNNQGGIVDGGRVNIVARYSDLGDTPTNDTDFDCDCLLQPTGPGRLEDFSGESSDGEWTLRMFTFGAGTLNEWCVSVFPDATAPTILRGDASGDGTVTGLGDGLFLLFWQFVEDSPAPGCMAAADANADGSVTGLGDGLFLLFWQFVEDSPAPPDPGPVECGPDPEEGECEVPQECP